MANYQRIVRELQQRLDFEETLGEECSPVERRAKTIEQIGEVVDQAADQAGRDLWDSALLALR